MGFLDKKPLYTQGVWEKQTSTHPDGREGYEINSNTDHGWSAVAQVEPNHLGTEVVTDEEAEANAELMAKAPQLYKTCKMLLWYYEAFRDKSPVGATERDDIANAEQLFNKLTDAIHR